MNSAVKIGLTLLGLAALIWRVSLYRFPSIGLTIIGIFLFIAIAIFYVKEIPMARQTLKWAWIVPLGAGLNFAAIIGNNGQMPYPHIMSSAWWVWLGDWLPGSFSPGDILMFTGFVGIIARLILMQRKQELIEA